VAVRVAVAGTGGVLVCEGEWKSAARALGEGTSVVGLFGQ
jgi:hypothetical protein